MARVNVTNFMANVDRNSWVHRMDPRTKVALILFFSTIPLLFTDLRFTVIYIALLIPLWATSNINFRPMLAPFIGVGFFIFIIFFFNAVRGPSELSFIDPLNPTVDWYYQLGPAVVTSHTVTRGIWLGLRLLAPMTIGLLIIATTDPTYLAKGLKLMKMPTWAVFMVLAGLRFIPIVMEQLYTILDAMTIRGVSKSRFERTKLLILPLFINALRRTRTMGLATEAKGFGANQWNYFYEDIRLQRADRIMLAAIVVVTAVSLVARFGYGLGVTGAVLGGIR